MKTEMFDLQCGHRTMSFCDGAMLSSPSQRLHLKFIEGVIKPLLIVLLLTASLQAQSLAEAARKEKERQSKVQASRVIVVDNSTVETPKPKAEDNKSAETKPAQGTTKPQPAPAPDPTKLWNERADQLRAKIRELQDKETALLLQQNDVTNQVYAVVTDPATQERAQAQLAQIQQQVVTVRADLAEAKKTLDSMLLEGPPKKSKSD
jgi:hypothetical protein